MPTHFPTAPTSTAKRIAVIGAGIVGITTAHELAADGHHVTLYDRCSSVAAEGSFANAGLLSPGSVSPASAPGLRPWLLRGLVGHEAALRWRPGLSLRQWQWMARWWRACNRSHADDVRTLVMLAHYSQRRLAAITQQARLDYEQSRGVLLLLRHEREFRPSRRHVLMLRELGIEANELTPDGCRDIEPGLGGHQALAGGVHLSGDGVGNCRQFAQQLRDHATSQFGLACRFGVAVQSLRCAPDSVTLDWQQSSSTGSTTHDAVVLCAGAAAAPLLSSMGCDMPLMPVQGHSVTLALRPDGIAPRSAIVDARSGVAITRMGSRVRITGGFELGSSTTTAPDERALSPLYAALDRWFPHATQRTQPQLWTGARPMLPEGPPVIAALPNQPRVWLNLGHGAHGWTLACGSARLLADSMAGRDTALPTRPFATDRWMRHGRA